MYNRSDEFIFYTKLIYCFLALIVIVIFYQLYRVLGRSDFLPEQAQDQNLFFDHTQITECNQKEIQGQWAMLRKIHNSLTPQIIIDELTHIFERVHFSFAKGKVSEVADFLSENILQSFKADIKKRKGYRMYLSFAKAPVCIIKQVAVDDQKICTVDTEFHSEQIAYIEDKDGVIVDNPHKISEDIKNYWIFKKNLSNISSPWVLVEMV